MWWTDMLFKLATQKFKEKIQKQVDGRGVNWDKN